MQNRQHVERTRTALDANAAAAHVTIDRALDAVVQHIGAVLKLRREKLHQEIVAFVAEKIEVLSSAQQLPAVHVPVLFDESEASTNDVCTQLAKVGRIGMDPPELEAYSEMDAVYINGQMIPPNKPIYTGRHVSFRMEPNTPAGLAFDASTGVLSGTPEWIEDLPTTVAAASRILQRQIVVENEGGSAHVTLSMTLPKTSQISKATESFLNEHGLVPEDRAWRYSSWYDRPTEKPKTNRNVVPARSTKAHFSRVGGQHAMLLVCNFPGILDVTCTAVESNGSCSLGIAYLFTLYMLMACSMCLQGFGAKAFANQVPWPW